ncbi:MAG: RNA polymerase sigma factor RpoH [Gammaproteobacteria bacterium]|jgi:RNA polymerase sigma-32 factor|nr:RNA polymerase sigma factor RpoH [Gammaproteobacteria bacterium]
MTHALDLPTPLGSLEAYIDAVGRVPLLTEDEERSLALRYREEDDLAAARRLVLSHLRFVVKVARGYLGYGLAHSDLIQEGNIGLMKAVKRFDPGVGVRLVSFAVHWVRAEIHEFILKNWRIVKVATTKAQRKLFFNLRSAKKRSGWLSHQEADVIASELGVDAKTVLLMEERMSAHDQAFDVSIEDGEDDPAPANYLADMRFEPSRQLEAVEEIQDGTDRLAQALRRLDDRSRDIVASRWLQEPKQTLQDLARKYSVSAERVRQIENQAFGTLRKALGGDLRNLLLAP